MPCVRSVPSCVCLVLCCVFCLFGGSLCVCLCVVHVSRVCFNIITIVVVVCVRMLV